MATYKPLQSVALTADTSSVTFSGIDQNYTDLVIVANCKNTTGATYGLLLRYNGDTGSNYSSTLLWGNGSSASSFRYTTQYNGVFTGWAGSTNFSPYIINIQNYANSTTFKTTLSRSSDAGDRVGAMVSLWRNTAAITSINISFEPTANIAVGSTFDLYGIKSGAPQALGGDVVTTDGNYWYHTFNTTGSFNLITQRPLTVDYLVVAGGGGGGSGIISASGGAGGGAGGFRTSIGGTPLTLSSSASYAVTVGAGGAGASGSNKGGTGNDSVFSTITSAGGGGGATTGGTSFGYPVGGENGVAGGSGGGAHFNFTTSVAGTPGAGNTPSTSPSQGNDGGVGSGSGSNFGSGGGGGAGGVGGNGTSSTGGAGGAGTANSISGSSVTYSGGGGGSSHNGGTGGAGGTGGGGAGGNGLSSNATSGTANTGGGGGGNNQARVGAAGGSGIVIVRYPV